MRSQEETCELICINKYFKSINIERWSRKFAFRLVRGLNGLVGTHTYIMPTPLDYFLLFGRRPLE